MFICNYYYNSKQIFSFIFVRPAGIEYFRIVAPTGYSNQTCPITIPELIGRLKLMGASKIKIRGVKIKVELDQYQ